MLWFKMIDDGVIRISDRHHPTFIAEPMKGHTAEELFYLFNFHPLVHSCKIVRRYPTLRREAMKKVLEVRVDTAEDLDIVLNYAEMLPEVRETYNTGLIAIQWHLIYRRTPPTCLCEVQESGGRVKTIKKLDDEMKVEPPPFRTMVFQLPDAEEISRVDLYDEWQNPVKSIQGAEKRVLADFMEHLWVTDPDILVASSPITTLRHVARRGVYHGMDIRFGRGGEWIHGRALVAMNSFYDMGIAGLVERARFTYAPIGVSHDWEAGKTIDSRQCAEAVKLDIMVPKMKGGFGFSTKAWDLIRYDKGGLVLSPQAGLHENVAVLDFESMFPNIIIKRNISYETVTEVGIDSSVSGFMAGFTAPFLERRLRFKHMRKDYSTGTREWWWCQQRQSALKLILVVIYGYSGCYANRFANVRVFQEINREAREAMVTALNLAIDNGFQVIYGPFDSLFVKRPDANKHDFEELAAEISETTCLPMGLDKHFKFLVLLTKTTDPNMVVANKYYGKLMDGGFFYRGIELRRHDTPLHVIRMQKDIIRTLFDAKDAEEAIKFQLPIALEIAHQSIKNVSKGIVDSNELLISKRLNKELEDYKARQPHIVAAMLGSDEEMSEYILVNTDNTNPLRRVMPSSMIDAAHRVYDKKKYEAIVRRAAWNLLRPFVLDEENVGVSMFRERQLKDYFIKNGVLSSC